MRHSLVIFSLILSSCLQEKNEGKISDDKIKSVSLSTYGGQTGYSRFLKITADSLYFDFNLAVDSKKRRHQVKPNTSYKLGDIIDTNKLISFSKIRNGNSVLPVDGTDTNITIETERTKYSVINGGSSKIWQNLETAIEKIDNKEFKTE